MCSNYLDVPYQKDFEITYEFHKTHYTALLQLAYMFDEGGVPIDHFMIEDDNGTLLNTSDPTYRIDVGYNVKVLMNISAHNCAGYSCPIFLEISQGWVSYWTVFAHSMLEE